MNELTFLVMVSIILKAAWVPTSVFVVGSVFLFLGVLYLFSTIVLLFLYNIIRDREMQNLQVLVLSYKNLIIVIIRLVIVILWVLKSHVHYVNDGYMHTRMIV